MVQVFIYFPRMHKGPELLRQQLCESGGWMEHREEQEREALHKEEYST